MKDNEEIHDGEIAREYILDMMQRCNDEKLSAPSVLYACTTVLLEAIFDMAPCKSGALKMLGHCFMQASENYECNEGDDHEHSDKKED